MNLWKIAGATGRANALAVGTLLLSVAAAASAGTFAIKVPNVQLGLSLLYPGQSTTLSYSLLGAGANAAGGIANVKIQFLSGATVVKTITINAGDPGAKPGANAVTINAADIPSGGPYTIRVTVTGGSITGTGYLPLTNPSDPNLQFLNPRGVDVNRIAGSATKGRIYVTEGQGGATANRTTEDGLYILNPDLTPAFPAPKATNTIINTIPGTVAGTFLGPWGPTANSPFRPYVAPDGSLLLPDSSDPHCALFAADANGDNVKAFFAYPFPAGGSRDNNLVYADAAPGTIPLYGSTAGVWLEGTGAARVLYAAGEDVAPGNSIQKYAVGTGTQDLAIIPTAFTPFSALDWYADLVRDSAGNTYLVSYALNDANKLDASGNSVATLPATGASYLGICIDDAHDVILLAANDGTVYKTNKAFDAVTPLFTGLGATVRDVAIDAENWIYAVDSTDELLHVWAPAGTYAVPNTTVDAAQTLSVVAYPTPGDLSPVGPTGLFVGPNGRRYGDGKVNVQDAVAVLRIAAGLDTIP